MSEAVEHRSSEQEELSLTFTGEALEALLEIARKENRRLDQVVEEALSLKQWTMEVRDDGGQVIARRGKKDERELVL